MELIECPHCHTPFEPTYCETFIRYPGDIDLVFDLVEARFNVNECPVCERKVVIAGELAILHTDEKSAIVFAHSEEVKKQIEAELNDYTVTFTNNHAESRKLMLGWLRWNMSLDKFQLRLLLSAVNRYLHVKITDTEGNLQDLDAMYLTAVKDKILSLFNACCEKRELLLLYEKIEENILPECITPEVLEIFLKITNEITDPKNSRDLATSFLMEYLNSVIHFHADVVNPKQNEFTELVYIYWNAHLDKPLHQDEQQFLLNKEVGGALVSFTYLFDLGMVKMPSSKDSAVNMKRLGKIMDNLGWAEEFTVALSERFVITGLDEKQAIKYAESVVKQLMDHIPLNKGEETHRAIGLSYRSSLTSICKMKQQKVAQTVVEKMLKTVEEEGDMVACIDICVQSVKTFNEFLDFDYSWALIQTVEKRYKEYFPKISGELHFDFLIEKGNTNRYIARFEDALSTYLAAQKLTEIPTVHPTDELKAEASKVLKRNIAIVYRELGRISLGERFFKELLTEYPDDFGITLNLATLYFKVNEYKLILDLLAPFNGNSLSLSSKDRSSLFLMQAIAGARLDNMLDASTFIGKALGEKRFLNNPSNAQMLMCALIVYSDLQTEAASAIEQQALQLLNEINDQERNSLVFRSLGLFLLARYLRTGKPASATPLVQMFGWENGIEYSDWHYAFYLCWYFFNTGNYPLAAKQAKQLIKAINEDIPVADDTKYAVGWMYDKEELQKQMQDIMYQLFLKKLVNETELLSIIEFSYGRELSIKLRPDEPIVSVDALLELVCEKHGKSVIIGFFETSYGVHFFFINVPKKQIIIPDTAILTVEEAMKINKRAENAFRDACPGLLHLTDKKLISFKELLSKLSFIFSQWIDEKIEQVILIPGKSLANLPLHLLPHGNATIAEKFPVVYINNLTTLVSIKNNARSQEEALIVTVTRREEKQEFIDRAVKTGNAIAELIKGPRAVTRIDGVKATIEEVKKYIPIVDEVLFLCHGASGADEDGKGICLAYKDHLPPSLLPVNDVATLKSFLLTWRDLDNLAKTPAVVVSIACSSGATVFGRGNINLGFEQALFAKGTSVIISPLWDVTQESAVYWIEQFYQYRLNQPGEKIETAYQWACVKTKDKFTHEYYWAPFILKGITN